MTPDRQQVSASEIGLSGQVVTKRQATRVESSAPYGSRAKGDHRPRSGIDQCLVAPNMHRADPWTLDERMDDLLLPWQVDLQLRHLIDNPELPAHIEHVGRLFCTATDA